jgi:hypothetical protein
MDIMMQMTFYQSCTVQILFDAWNVTDCGSYTASLLAIVVFGIARHYLSAVHTAFRVYAHKHVKAGSGDPKLSAGTSKASAETDWLRTHSTTTDVSQSSVAKYEEGLLEDCCGKDPAPTGVAALLVSSPLAAAVTDWLLAFALLIIGFSNMLIAMTFNGGCFLAVCAGEALGMLLVQPPVTLCNCQRSFRSRLGLGESTVINTPDCH